MYNQIQNTTADTNTNDINKYKWSTSNDVRHINDDIRVTFTAVLADRSAHCTS